MQYKKSDVRRTRVEGFDYDPKGLLQSYKVADLLAEDSCLANGYNSTEWQYFYNPLGEREQKRMYKSPQGDNDWGVHPWVYYLLGGNNEQLAVYHGTQMSDDSVYLNNGSKYGNIQGRKVFFYPAEFNTYVGSSPSITWQYSGSAWVPEHKISDHIGTLRTIVKNNNVVFKKDYYPFGEEVQKTGEAEREGFVGQEEDIESSLGDHGVRKYEDKIGRFTSIDPLYEKYYDWSPYQYSANNPIIAFDIDGMKFNYKSFNSADPKKAEAFVEEAISYLLANGAEEEAQIIIDLRDRQDITIYIQVVEGQGSEFIDNKNTPRIKWDPKEAIITDDGNTQSPALGLLHEADHARDFFADPETNHKNLHTKDKDYDNLEEKRVIEGIETCAALKLGEGVRTRHHGYKTKRVESPSKR